MPDDQERTDPRTNNAQRGNPQGDGAQPRRHALPDGQGVPPGARAMQSAFGGNGTQPDKGLITRSPGAPGVTGQDVPPSARDQSQTAAPRAKRKKKVVPVEQKLLMGSYIRALAEKEKSRKRKSSWRKVPEPQCDLLVLERAADIEPQPLEWLWPGRIPMGRLTLIAGEPGVGKSLVTLDLAARVTRGAPWPDDPDRPQRKAGHVLIVGPDDELRATVVPRLICAGARLERTFCASGVYNKHPFPALGSKRGFRLPDDIPSLRNTIVELAPVRLIVLDPLWAFLGGRPEHRITTGPDILAPLADLAAIYGVAIVGVTGIRGRPRAGILEPAGHRSLLSARAAWGIAKVPRKRRKRVMFPMKMNLGPETNGLDFKIVDGGIEWDKEPSTVTTEAILAASSETALERAAQWLRICLTGGGVLAAVIAKRAHECGVSQWMLRRAKNELGVRAEKHGYNGDTYWTWSLDDDAEAVGANENGRNYGN